MEILFDRWIVTYFSVGSAGSINESSSCSKISNNGSFDSNQSVAGSSTSERDRDPDVHLSSRFNAESDVEILSNPSQSSIEVLDSSKNSSRKHSEERKISHVPSLETITDHSSFKGETVVEAGIALGAEEKTRGHLAEKKDLIRQTFLNLTESSSSGSITDSICTAYEHSQEAEEHKHLSPVEVISEENNRTQTSIFGEFFFVFSRKLEMARNEILVQFSSLQIFSHLSQRQIKLMA